MNSKVLLLQGPMGPFFQHFSKKLKSENCEVFKINFNAGDRFFYPNQGAFSFDGDFSEWETYLRAKLFELDIDRIYLFGDTRAYHKIARQIAKEMDIVLYVFEEGYLRPHYVTLEEDGVNGNSKLPKNANFYKQYPVREEKKAKKIPYAFSQMILIAIVYYLVAWIGQKKFPFYRHHRSFNPLKEGGALLLSAFRKFKYKYEQAGILQSLTFGYSKKFFLVPLQVHNDAQIKEWSNFKSVATFIRKTIISFAKNAPEDTLLVIKHHPLDRGYCNYKKLIEKVANKYDCSNRIVYIHDQHLPTLLDHAKGTVLINSTVGLSSLLHNTPVITLGHAVYNLPGLTYQGQLSEFWCANIEIDKDLNRGFRHYLLTNNQINANFYSNVSNIDYVFSIKAPEYKQRVNVRLA